MTYFLSIGFDYSALIAISIAISWAFAYALTRPIRCRRSRKVLGFLIGVAVYSAAWIAMEKDFGVGEMMTSRKIEYHCWKEFNEQDCIRLIYSCPECALSLDRWKRLKIAARLDPLNFENEIYLSRKEKK